MTKFIMYFEPMCIEADNVNDVEKIYRFQNSKPDILRIVVDQLHD